MLIDVTYPLKATMISANTVGGPGHLGTHFDIMDKQFPLDYSETEGLLFNVPGRTEIGLGDVDLSRIHQGDFVLLRTAWIEEHPYDSPEYHHGHPQVSHELIQALVGKHIRLIGVDNSGLRRGPEHTPADQYCADHSVFVIENLCNLDVLLLKAGSNRFHMHTYPLNIAGLSGEPARVVAEVR